MRNRSLRKALAAALVIPMFLSLGAVPTSAESIKEAAMAAAEEEALVGESSEGVTGDCKWSYDETTATLTFSSNTGTSAEVPSFPEWASAPWWKDCARSCKHVVFTDDIVGIGEGACCGFWYLESVQLSSNLKTIGDRAFSYSGYDNIQQITFPESLETIGAFAFEGWSKLTEVRIPKNVKSIAGNAFSSCEALEQIIVDGENPYFCSESGVLYDKAKTTLVICPPAKKNVEFPSSLNKLGSHILSGTAVSEIKFTGDAPTFAEDTFGNGMTGEIVNGEWVEKVNPLVATAYYPADNTSWTADKRQNYSGNITWVPYGENGTVAIASAGIYAAKQDNNGVFAGMVTSGAFAADKEYRWLCYDIKAEAWSVYSDWTLNNEWIQFNPGKAGDYLLQGEVRIAGQPDTVKTDCIGVNHHPHIKGKCQMPYSGEGGGYLIGVESYENADYQYEMLILDCTLLAEGKDAWTYTTGKCGVDGNGFWTVWQPEYGYYWTLFRIYDKDGNLIDEDCYGFQNI